jgi:hypothetical protein
MHRVSPLHAPAPAAAAALASVPARRSSTTYADLTSQAARCIARARAMACSPAAGARGTNATDAAALHDLAAALVNLGEALARPLAPAAGPPRRRRGGPDARLLRSLEAVAVARDWSEPRPAEGPGAALAEAAFLIRSAADLWSTHHSADGRPRSPEASRMRHPATLGAASSEWRTLVARTADTGEAMAQHSARSGLSETAVEDLRKFPRPHGEGSAPAAREDLLDLTVARPGIRRGQLPLDELSDRVTRLRHLAWTLAEVGSAPATVQGNLAAIAISLHRAAANAHRSMAEHAPPGPARTRHLKAATRAEKAQLRWRDVAAHVQALRTPHPGAHPIQIERLDIERLLSRVAPSGLPQSKPEVGWALSRIAESFVEVAEHNAVALRAAQDRGDLLLVGRAIPTEALSRRPDLLTARLTDQVIPAPTAMITRLESSYRAITRERTSRVSPDAVSPDAVSPDAVSPDISPPAA